MPKVLLRANVHEGSQSSFMTSSKITDNPPSLPNTGESQQDSGDKLHVQVLSAFFHLGCTNVVAKSTVGVLSLRVLQDALVKTLEEINVDIVEFVACHFSVSRLIPNSLVVLRISIYLTGSVL